MRCAHVLLGWITEWKGYVSAFAAPSMNMRG